MLFKAFLFTTSLLVVFHFSTCDFKVKQCYECEYFDLYGSNDTNDEACKDNPGKFLRNCNETTELKATEWQCVKVTGRIEVDDENYNYYKRACSPGKNYDTCKDCKSTNTYETRHGFVKRGQHCVCDDSNGCNAANGLIINTITVAAGLLLATILNL